MQDRDGPDPRPVACEQTSDLVDFGPINLGGTLVLHRNGEVTSGNPPQPEERRPSPVRRVALRRQGRCHDQRLKAGTATTDEVHAWMERDEDSPPNRMIDLIAGRLPLYELCTGDDPMLAPRQANRQNVDVDHGTH